MFNRFQKLHKDIYATAVCFCYMLIHSNLAFSYNFSSYYVRIRKKICFNIQQAMAHLWKLLSLLFMEFQWFVLSAASGYLGE